VTLYVVVGVAIHHHAKHVDVIGAAAVVVFTIV
jgi:hypothetical protein